MSGVVTDKSAVAVDRLSTRRIDEMVYIGNVAGLVNNQIINIHPVTRLDKNPAQLGSVVMAEQMGRMASRWVEKKDDIAGVETWAKLNGVTSTISSRDISLIENQRNFRKVMDVGVMKAPTEISDEDTKIAVTGLGIESINMVSNAEFSGAYAGYILYPPVGKHIYIAPTGRISTFLSMKYGGSANPVEVYVYSDDGGKTWAWYRIDLSTENSQEQGSFCADYYGNLHFVWRETIDANDKRIRYRKWTAATGGFGSIVTVSAPTGVLTVCPVIQPTPLGDTVEIVWGSDGYADDASYFQLLIREVLADGSLGTLYQLTTDGAALHRYIYFSFDYDSQGYRHIIAIAKNHATEPDPGNIWYIRQTSGGWQAKALVNSDAGDANLAHYVSNIVINKNDEVFIVYDIGTFDVTAKNPLYIKKISGGTIGSRTLVEAGDPGVGGSIPQIQLDDDDRICIIYGSNTAPDTYSMRIVSRNLSEIGSRKIIYTLPAGQEMSYIHIPWSVPPNIQGVNPNVPLQGMVMIIAKYASATPEKADIQIHYSDGAVFGATPTPSKISTHSYNIRGIVSRSKFNNGFNPVI